MAECVFRPIKIMRKTQPNNLLAAATATVENEAAACCAKLLQILR